MSQRLGEGNSRGSDVLELMRRNFKRITCLRRYEKEIQEDQMSQRLLKEIQVDQMYQTLSEGNSRGSDILELMRKNFKRIRCLRRYENEIQENQMSQTL